MPTGHETIEIHAAPERDRNGDAIGPAPAPVTVEGCITWPKRSLEEGRGWVTIDGLDLYLPPGVPVPAAEDQVLARGGTWSVDGEPAVYNEKGAIVSLKRRTT